MTDIQNISAASAGEAVDEELIEQAYEMMAGGQPAGEKPERKKYSKEIRASF